MSGLMSAALAITLIASPFGESLVTHRTTDSQLKNAEISVPRTSQYPQMCRPSARTDFASPRRAIREHACAATRMALLVEDPHPLTKMGFSTLRGSLRALPHAFSKHSQIRSHERGQQPWEVMSLLSTPWEKFAPRATRDSPNPDRCCPLSRVAPPLPACEVRCDRNSVFWKKRESAECVLGDDASANSVAPFNRPLLEGSLNPQLNLRFSNEYSRGLQNHSYLHEWFCSQEDVSLSPRSSSNFV